MGLLLDDDIWGFGCVFGASLRGLLHLKRKLGTASEEKEKMPGKQTAYLNEKRSVFFIRKASLT